MHEKIRSIGLIASKIYEEEIAKFFLDVSAFEPLKLNEILDLELDTGRGEHNPYDEILRDTLYLLNRVGKKVKPYTDKVSFPIVIDIEELKNFYSKIADRIRKLEMREKKISEKLKMIEDRMMVVEKLSRFNVESQLSRFGETNFFGYKFGRILKEFSSRVVEGFRELPIVYRGKELDENYIWILMIYPKEHEKSVMKVLSMAGFNEFSIPTDVDLTPREYLLELRDMKRAMELEMMEIEIEIKKVFYENRRYIYDFFDTIYVLKNVHDFLRNAGTTENFFTLVGWMTEESLRKLKSKYGNREDLMIFEDVKVKDEFEKPVLLRNNGFFKPFESIVEMYGLPSPSEIDPTPVVSILFMLFYGMMFGDVGHGLILSIFGFLMARRFKSDIYRVIGFGGLASILFGFLYGSFFGFEILPALFARPMERTDLFIEISIILGVILITFGMVLNLVNKLKNSKLRHLFFDHNGFPGLFMYLFSVFLVFDFMKDSAISIPSFLIYPAYLIPILLIFSKEIVFGDGKISDRVIQSFFETFDHLLSYFSNTLSFIRLGAFAMNHAGLFLAFMIMSEMMKNGFSKFVILLLGNILIMGLEGLIVFIQALRLEFYEFFSRFYEGNGRKFKPVKYCEVMK